MIESKLTQRYHIPGNLQSTKNLETTPKMFKVGAIFISGPFFLGGGGGDFTFFNAITVHYPRN